MKNIAIVNVVNNKSTGKIALNLLNQLSEKGYNVVFYYGRGEISEDPRQIRMNTRFGVWLHAFMSRLTGLQGFYSHYATWRMVTDMKRRDIDTVIMLNPHAYYLNEKIFYSFIAKKNLRFIYIIPDGYAYLGNCSDHTNCVRYIKGNGNCPDIHRYPVSWLFDTCPLVMKGKENNYKKLKRAIFVGPEFVVDNVKRSYLGKYMPTAILDEAIDLSLYKPYDASNLRAELGIDANKVIVLCIAPPYKNKNVGSFIKVADYFKRNDKYVFIHIGRYESSSHDNYIHIDFVKENSDLAVYYSMADLFLFPSLEDTMSNACLEALACGTPLLTFNISGMPYLMDETVGKMVEARNVEQLIEVVKRTEKKTQDVVDRCRAYAERRYDMSKYSDKLIEIIKTGQKDSDCLSDKV